MAKLSAVSTFVAVLASSVAWAAPSLETRQGITPLSPAQVESFKPYTYFASAAYCNPNTTANWTCGANCEANPDFIPIDSGGNGTSVQYWYVGYSPSLETVVVAHQGTNTSDIESIANDLKIIQRPLNALLFPGLGPNITVHEGFSQAQEKTAEQILAAVNSAIDTHGATKVTLVGHSLGAAISLIDSVYLPLHVSGVTFKSVLYGLPRVGGQNFANYVDANTTDRTHINNRKDPVPIVLGMFLGYRHSSGEVHIGKTGEWLSCPGQDNPSDLCIVGAVPSIFEGVAADHSGPYDGVEMGC